MIGSGSIKVAPNSSSNPFQCRPRQTPKQRYWNQWPGLLCSWGVDFKAYSSAPSTGHERSQGPLYKSLGQCKCAASFNTLFFCYSYYVRPRLIFSPIILVGTGAITYSTIRTRRRKSCVRHSSEIPAAVSPLAGDSR